MFFCKSHPLRDGEKDMSLRSLREALRAGGDLQPLLPLQGRDLLLQGLPEAALERRTQGQLPGREQEGGHGKKRPRVMSCLINLITWIRPRKLWITAIRCRRRHRRRRPISPRCREEQQPRRSRILNRSLLLAGSPHEPMRRFYFYCGGSNKRTDPPLWGCRSQ